MKNEELWNIAAGILILFVVISLGFVFAGEFSMLGETIVFSVVVVGVSVLMKKWAASILDCDVEHRIWNFYRFGFIEHWHFKKERPFGIFAPLFLSVISLGWIKFMGILTYETRALKRRAAKRWGPYSYTEMTDWHNSLIGAAGILGSLILMIVSYALSPAIPLLQGLPTLAAYYAFWNMIPFSKLDGNQILAGSRPLFVALALITLIATLATFAIA